MHIPGRVGNDDNGNAESDGSDDDDDFEDSSSARLPRYARARDAGAAVLASGARDASTPLSGGGGSRGVLRMRSPRRSSASGKSLEVVVIDD
jgi:hypothetical protein